MHQVGSDCVAVTRKNRQWDKELLEFMFEEEASEQRDWSCDTQATQWASSTCSSSSKCYCCCSCLSSVCRTESVRTSSISCWRVTSPEVGGRGGDETDAETTGSEAITGGSRRLRCPRNESEKMGSWSAGTTALSGRSSLGVRKVNLFSEYLTQVPFFHSKPKPNIASSPIPLDGLHDGSWIGTSKYLRI